MNPHPASHRLEGHAAGDHDAEVATHTAACDACRAYVERLAAAATTAPSSPALARALATNGRRRATPLALGFVPLAAAAAVILLVHRAPVPPVTPTDPVASTRFKGGLQLTTIRERGENQQRFAGPFGVRAGDRFRVEIAVDREGPITAGVLADDGAWLTLLAPAVLESGTHLSERAAQVDDHPTRGVILAGAPDDVVRARATRDFTGVAVVAVQPEP